MKGPLSYSIRPADMKRGMYVIVSEWYKPDVSVAMAEAIGLTKPLGIPLRIEKVAMPFIVVSYMPEPKMRGVMDTRRSAFMRVPLSYVKAILPGYKKNKEALRNIPTSSISLDR